jgi:hypothetical protein
MAQFDLCHGSTTKIIDEQLIQCGVDCYEACQSPSPRAPDVACGGRWPGP